MDSIFISGSEDESNNICSDSVVIDMEVLSLQPDGSTKAQMLIPCESTLFQMGVYFELQPPNMYQRLRGVRTRVLSSALCFSEKNVDNITLVRIRPGDENIKVCVKKATELTIFWLGRVDIPNSRRDILTVLNKTRSLLECSRVGFSYSKSWLASLPWIGSRLCSTMSSGSWGWVDAELVTFLLGASYTIDIMYSNVTLFEYLQNLSQ